jgi:transcriptional regulator with XRE-family HTH domain
MSIQERLQLVLKMHNLSPSAFADQIGVQRSALSHVLTGRNKPGLDFLEKILNHFPRVNAHWLITGIAPKDNLVEGKVLKTLSPKPLEESKENKNEERTVARIVLFYEDRSFDEYRPNEKDIKLRH